MKQTSCQSTPGTRSCYISYPHPVLHSLQVLVIFFSWIFVFLSLFQNHFQSNLPPFPSTPASGPPCLPIPHSSVAKFLDNLQTTLLCQSSITRHGLRFPRYTNFLFSMLLLLAGDINLNPGPSTLNFSHLNTRSVSSITTEINKPAVLQEFITDHSLDILALTETWLSPNTLPSTLNSLTPPSYSILHSPRLSGKGGGLALIYRSHLKIQIVSIPQFSSFESFCVRFSISSTSYTILTIYRPPLTSKSLFNSELSTLLEDLASHPSELIITGDFNIHIDDQNSSSTSSFLTLLDTFGLSQLVSFPTHISGHTLDLLITRTASNIVSEIDFTLSSISDHSAILSVLSVPSHSRTPRITKLIRNIKSINTVIFSNDILSSCLYSAPASTLHAYCQQFSATLSMLLDKHAPLKTISCRSQSCKPFITPEILKEKSKRSKLESIFRRNKTAANKARFKQQARLLDKLITASRRSYYRTLISNSSYQPKKLWSALDALLSRKSPPCFPTSIAPDQLASSFLNFFGDKITKLCSTFTQTSTSCVSALNKPPFTPPHLSSFAPATADEVRAAILSASNATCSLDSIPTRLLKSCLDSLIHPITTIINLSLSAGVFPDDLKTAIVTPLHKKHSLPHEELSSYRPISNLNFISKVLERIIHSRLTNHLESFPSMCPFQSAYRKFHSTESALLRIYNDLLLAINHQKVSALILLDLSAAFDTIDHQILLSRLATNFGLSGTAFSLLSSYLKDRSQCVSIGSINSPSSTLHTGIPQGSVLGPLLFCLYTSPLGHLLSDTPVSYHLYADDTQLYISFSSSDSIPNLNILSSALDSVYSWLYSNRLSVNPTKTEYLLIGTPQQRSKLVSSSIVFRGNLLKPSENCRNLGVVFDSHLSFKKHFSDVCRSSFYHIRQLRQIRSSLDKNSATVLANALVSSKLDYCNSLFYGLPASSLDRFQRVQNALARVVIPSVKRHHHISPTLQKLHWLPIPQRITFKIASLTFKTLHQKQPSYLAELLIPYNPSRILRSSDKNLLVVPNIKSAQGRRSFSFAAPTIWNSLPPALRASPTFESFHRDLKTHLFPP